MRTRQRRRAIEVTAKTFCSLAQEAVWKFPNDQQARLTTGCDTIAEQVAFAGVNPPADQVSHALTVVVSVAIECSAMLRTCAALGQIDDSTYQGLMTPLSSLLTLLVVEIGELD